MIRAWITSAALIAVFAGSLLVSPSDADAGRRHRRNACCNNNYGYSNYGGWSNGYAYGNSGCQTAFQQPVNTGCCSTNGFAQYGDGSHTTGYAPQGTTTYGTNGTFGTNGSISAPQPPAEQQLRQAPNDSAPPAAPEPKIETAPEPRT